jgi:hypothetical protein
MSARPQRRSGNLSALKVEIWASIREVAAIVGTPGTPVDLKVCGLSAIAAAGGVYLRILESERQANPTDTPALPGDIILIRSTSGSNGHHGD